MSDKNDELSAFVKKQFNEKKDTKESSSKGLFVSKKDIDQIKSEEELEAEKELEEAKKTSSNKAAQINQTRMMKKIFMEKFMKYLIFISLISILIIAFIKLIPLAGKFLNGLVSRIIFGFI